MDGLPRPAWVSHVKMRQLQLLARLQTGGSLLHAAEDLGMSQSAASKLLSALEDDIGMPLFERHARGVTPTPYGEIFLRRAVAVLTELTRAAEEMNDYRRGSRMPLNIGSLLSPSSSFLPAALLRLAREAPDMLLNVKVDTSRALLEGIMESRFDLVIARVRDASRQPELVFEPLVAEPFWAVARPDHPLASKQGLRLDDLMDQPWILPPMGTDLRARLDALCVQNGLPVLTSLIETLSVPLMFSVLRMSDALVLLPKEFAKPYCDAGWLSALPIDLGVRAENYGLITRRHVAPSPQVRHALKVFRETAVSVWGRTIRNDRS
ncbi:MAG: LysR family transcriptional regulator [Variovorax sp.]